MHPIYTAPPRAAQEEALPPRPSTAPSEDLDGPASAAVEGMQTDRISRLCLLDTGFDSLSMS